VLIEAKIIETSLTNTEKLGIDWTHDDHGDRRPQAHDIPLWIPSKRAHRSSCPANDPTATVPLGIRVFRTAAASDFALGTLDFTKFQMVLNFLRSRTNTKLIASPRIVTVNNQKAKINVGQVIPIADL